MLSYPPGFRSRRRHRQVLQSRQRRPKDDDAGTGIKENIKVVGHTGTRVTQKELCIYTADRRLPIMIGCVILRNLALHMGYYPV